MSAITADPRRPGATAHAQPGRVPRLLRGPAADPRWARPALLAVLAATALLYAAGLSRNGWANDFYSAAVQAGTRSWKAFFFGSFDASNFITVDKTPASLWVMELSARIFGLNYWSVLLPQAAEGVAAAGLLYATVRRWSGPAAGILAAGVLASTPVAALMFRFNNPDALLVLLMVAAAYAMTRAIDSGRTGWITLAGALLGFGFLTKMLQAFLVLPAFALAYLVAGPPRLGRRIWQLLAGGAAMLVAAGWWVAIVQFTPAADRPYIGGSTTNSVLQLALGYNGLGRLNGNETGSVGFSNRGGGGGGGGGTAFGGPASITRLFASEMGGQISWLIPAALVALAGLLWLTLRSARTDRIRAAALLWGGWLLVTGAVFSFMAGIIHPYYTVALAPAIGALVGIGAVAAWRERDRLAARALLAAGLAVTALWAYVLLDRTPGWLPWLRFVILLTGLAAAAAILASRPLNRRWPARPALASGFGTGLARTAASQPGATRARLAMLAVPLALIAGLAGPVAYSLDTASTAHTGAIPSAGPATSVGGPGGGPGGGGRPGAGFGGPGSQTGTGQGRASQGSTGAGQAGTGTGSAAGRPSGAGRIPGVPGGTAGARPSGTGGATGLRGGPGGGLGGSTQVSSSITRLLTSGASGYRWAAATVGAESAAPFQLASGEPILAIGGFNGSDAAPALAQFKALVAAREIHYFIGANSGSFGGGTGTAAQITTWVTTHYTKQTVGGVTIYNLTKPTT